MKTKLLSDLFREVSSNRELQDNHVANTLIKHCNEIDFTTRELCYEDVLKYYPKTEKFGVQEWFKEAAWENTLHKDQILDYRINRVELNNIKCYTNSPDGSPYGISFLNNDQPCSAVIYGTNGVGKSAIFGALEYIYTSQVSEYKLKQSNQSSNGLSLLAHDGLSERCLCNIYTPSQFLTINNRSIATDTIFFAENCFINETTTSINGNVDFDSCEDCSAHQLIANGVGLKELMDVSLVFSKMSSYNRQKERREYTTANLAVTQSRNLLSNWNDQIIQISAKLSLLSKTEDKISYENDIEHISSIATRLLSNQLVFPENANRLESCMRDFLISHQNWSDINNFVEIEHRYEMVTHAKHLVSKDDDLCVCPLCLGTLKNSDFNRNLELQIDTYNTQISFKTAADNAMEAFFDELDNIIHICDGFILAANELTVQLSNYSQFKYSLAILKDIAALVNTYKNNDYIHKILSIRESGEKLTELHKFLYFELEHLVIVSDNIFDRCATLLAEFYNDLVSMLNHPDIAEQIDITKQIGLLEQELDYISSQISKERIHLSSLIEISNQARQHYDMQVIVSEQIKRYAPYLQSAVNKRVIESFLPIKDTIEQIMEMFLIDDNIKLDINCINDYISISILTQSNARVTPAAYFNAFRYKLFCTAFSLATVLVVRQNMTVNLPIVFDDPFIGFDTNNREVMVKFIKKMTQIIQQYNTPEKPIQLISFTHNWQLFQILRTALQPSPLPKFLILDNHKSARKVDSYYELTRQV